MPGVGPNTARTPTAELPEPGTFETKRIASLAGLAPYTGQSGWWRGESMIGGGRKIVGSALFLAARVAGRHNPVPKAFRQRLVEVVVPVGGLRRGSATSAAAL